MFDPYHKWLGILPKDQPPNHYRLLSLEPLESDLDVIEGAADRQMGFVRQYQSGEYAALAAKLLNEIAAARLCLLKPKSKADYDAKLRAELKAKEVTANGGDLFSFDTELASLSNTSRGRPEINRKAKRQRKPKSSSGGLLIAGGVGATIVIIVVVLLMNSRPSTSEKAKTIPAEIADAAKSSPAAERPKPLEANVPALVDEQKDAMAVAGDAELPMTHEPPEAQKSISLSEPHAIRSSINLLALVDPKRDAIIGTWTRDGDVLRMMGNSVISKLAILADVPAEYKLTIRLARELGGNANNECLVLCLPVGPFMADVFLDAFGSSISGISVDQYQVNHQLNVSTRRLQAILPDVVQQLEVTVHKNSVKVTKGSKTLVDWTGSAERLWMSTDWATPSNRIGLGSYHGRFRFEELQLTAIESSTSSEIVPDSLSDPMSIIDSERDARVTAKPPAEVAAKCLTWKGRKYFISEKPVTFQAALEMASQMNGRLLTISSREEEVFLHQQGNGRYLWTAMWRRPGSEEWRDERDQPVKFIPEWAPGQPNMGDYEILTVLQTSNNPGNRGLHDAAVTDQWSACIEWGNEFPGKSNPRTE